jgi:hypothetical protein
MAIRAAASFPEDIALMWSNPNKQSLPGTRKAGLRRVCALPRFVQPCGPLRETVRRAHAKGSKTPERPRIEAATAAATLRDGGLASLLCVSRNKRGDRLATPKDLDYLRWRYGRFEEYRAVRTDAGEEAAGMVIFRPRRHGPFWASHVCELFVEGSERRTARRLLRRVRDAAPADFIECSFPSRRQAAQYGFVQYPGSSVLMAYPLEQNLVPDPTQRASWALSLGDLELL